MIKKETLIELEQYLLDKSSNFTKEALDVLLNNGSYIFNTWLETLTTENGVINTGYNEISRLESQLNTMLQTNQIYNERIIEYLGDYQKILALNKKIQNEQGIDVKSELPTLSEKQKFIYDKLEYDLKKGGIKTLYVEPTKAVAYNAITFGDSIADAKKRLKKEYEKPIIESRLNQIARDSIFTYNGIVNGVIAETYELDAIFYSGNLVSDSRPFCVRCSGKTIPIKEFNQILKEYLASDALNKGMYSITYSDYKDNFFAYRGGWQCLHMPIATKSKTQ